jgi:hypothetical protein
MTRRRSSRRLPPHPPPPHPPPPPPPPPDPDPDPNPNPTPNPNQALAALRAASAALVAPGVQPPAADAAEQRSPSAEFSCVSLVPTATDAWCLATCGSSKGLSCPLAMCKCDGGEVLAETKLIDPTKMDGTRRPATRLAPSRAHN